MSPDDEMAALWYHLEPMCSEIPAPRCSRCHRAEELVQPDMLYYACRYCYPESHDFKYLKEINANISSS